MAGITRTPARGPSANASSTPPTESWSVSAEQLHARGGGGADHLGGGEFAVGVQRVGL